jgi:hypothetical protein
MLTAGTTGTKCARAHIAIKDKTHVKNFQINYALAPAKAGGGVLGGRVMSVGWRLKGFKTLGL